jgi:hypothetical protein
LEPNRLLASLPRADYEALLPDLQSVQVEHRQQIATPDDSIQHVYFPRGAVISMLVLTLGTVANHVAHILHKLDVKSRVQIAIWAMATGLVEPRAVERTQPVSLADLPFRRSARSGSAEDAV